MKIMLIRPRPSPETIGLQHVMICEPLELEYLCAGVADLGHETLIVDMILEKKSFDDIFREHAPDLIGVTAYITHVDISKEYCRAAKRLNPACYTMVGGVHAEVVPEDFADDAIDFIVRANGIATFREVVSAIAGGADAHDSPGLWTPGTPDCPKETTFDHPPPDRSKVDRYRSRYYYLFHNPCALMKTSFGCLYECSFCFCRGITDGAYFERSMDSVIAELKTIPERDVYIVDDNFLISRDRVLEFSSRLREERIDKRFLVYGRADFIAANEDVIAEFGKRGLRAVIVGLESCNADELERYDKRSDLAANEGAVHILARYGIDCYATLILGMDWDRSDFDRLGRWLRELDLTFINLQPFTPLPGTPMLDEHRQALIVPRRQFEEWDLAHLVLAPTRMSISAYYWNILRLYYTVTMRPAKLLGLTRRHGLRASLRMLAGSARITRQYLAKALRVRKARAPVPDHCGETL